MFNPGRDKYFNDTLEINVLYAVGDLKKLCALCIHLQYSALVAERFTNN